MRHVGRLAWQMSWRGGQAQRHRAVGLAVAAAIAVLVVGAVLGTSMLIERVTDRALGRSFVPTAPDEPAALRRHAIFDSAPNGDQIYIYWWRIEDDRVTIPGVPRRPPLDTWYVSPELAERVEEDPVLRARFPRPQRIRDEGVANADELVAYRFVSPHVELREDLSARTDEAFYLADPRDLSSLSMVRAALALFVIPIVGLLLAAVAPAAPAIDSRLRILDALGASRSFQRTVVGASAVLSAAPGAAIATLAWWALSRRLTTVPLVGREVLRGDLAISGVQAAAAAVVVVAMAVIAAIVRPHGVRANRPSEEIAQLPSVARAVPGIIGVAMMMLGSGAFGRPSDRLFIAGLVAASVGGVLSLPLVLYRFGGSLGRSSDVAAFLVGRRLQWTATDTARPMLVLGAICVLAPVAVSWIDVNRLRVNDGQIDAAIQPAWILGDLADEEVAGLRAATGAVTIELASDPHAQPTRTSDIPIVMVGDCRDLGQLVELSRCGGGHFEIAPGAADGFARFRAIDEGVPQPLAGVAVMPTGYEVVATLFVSDDWRSVDAVLRRYAANIDHGDVVVGHVFNPLHESPLTKWLLGGFTAATLVAAGALLLHVVAHAARLATTRWRLIGIGADERTLGRLAAIESAVAVALAGLISVGLGVVATWLFVGMNPDARINVTSVGAILFAVAAAAGASAATSWVSATSVHVTSE
jgi:hypothetical protein